MGPDCFAMKVKFQVVSSCVYLSAKFQSHQFPAANTMDPITLIFVAPADLEIQTQYVPCLTEEPLNAAAPLITYLCSKLTDVDRLMLIKMFGLSIRLL